MADVGVNFWTALDTFSRRVLRKLRLPDETPWKYAGWGKSEGMAKGAILHYTADENLESVLRWFMNPEHGANASAHLVVAQEWATWLVELAHDLPEIMELPVPVVKCCSLLDRAWHARAANEWAYGIELCNMGEVRSAGDGLVCWRNDWTQPWGGSAISLFGRQWEPWRYSQIQTVVSLLKYLHGYGLGIIRRLVLGHEQVQVNKRDPGPLFPLREVRQGVFDGTPLNMALWLQNWTADQSGYMLRQALKIALEYAGGADSGQAMAVLREKALQAEDDPKLVRAMLSLLGYDVGAPELNDVEIPTFQRMMKLSADGIAGPVTRQALRDRLIDRGII